MKYHPTMNDGTSQEHYSTDKAVGRIRYDDCSDDDEEEETPMIIMLLLDEEARSEQVLLGQNWCCAPNFLLLPPAMGGLATVTRSGAAGLPASTPTTKRSILALLAVVVVAVILVLLVTVAINNKGVKKFSEKMGHVVVAQQKELEALPEDHDSSSTDALLAAGTVKMTAAQSHSSYEQFFHVMDKPRKDLIDDVGEEKVNGMPDSSFRAAKTTTENNPTKETTTVLLPPPKVGAEDDARNLQQGNEIDCALSQESSFVYRILVKLNNLNGTCVGSTTGATTNGTLSENDKEQITNVIVNSFSTLGENYCDPYVRNVTSADIVRQQVSPAAQPPSVTLEVQVLGTLRCQASELGCNVTKIGLFHSPGQVDPQEQQEPACSCPLVNNTALIATDRGPTEAEFIEHFGVRLATVASSLDCPGLQASECAFGTVFQSALAVTFADEDAARNASDLIGSEALKTLIELYTPDDPTICYPEFRVFDSVNVVFQEARRQLQDTMTRPNASPPANVSVPATAGLVNGTEPSSTIGNVTSAPSSSPSSLDSVPSLLHSLTAILYIGGRCSQCGSDLFFQNDVSTRRRLHQASFQDAMEDRPGRRKLQAINATTMKSDCFCPIDSVAAEVPGPGIEEFETTLAERLQLEITATQQVDPESIVVVNDDDNFVNNRIYRYACTNISSTFKKNVTLEVQVTCGSAPELSDEDKNKIGFVYANAFNNLRTTVCDPFNLEMTSAKVVETGDLRAGGTSSSLPLRIEVTMICYGCDPLATDVYGFPEIFLEEETTEGINNETRRNLYSTDELKAGREQEAAEGMCTCNSTLPRRAPLEADVTDAFDLISVQQQDVLPACIGNATTCDFGKIFTTSALVEIQSSLAPLETASILEQAFTNALDRLIGGGNATVCNSLFGLVTDAEVDLDFVYNSVDKNPNETVRRQLQDLPTVAPTSDSTFTFWMASGSNITNTPTMAPTDQVVSATDYFLLSAFGLCNGCPAELVFSNAAADGRRRIDQIGTEDKTSSKAITQSRLLQDVAEEEPESECFCPIGSVQVVTDFAQISLLEIIQEEVAKISSNLTVTGAVSGLTRVDCVEETPFSTTIDFRFSAFEWVVNNPGDIQGLGDALANTYNGLVEEFCDEYFRNSISLTYVAGSLQRSSGTGRRHDRDLQTMQGCFNYRATFTVTGLCRGCQALGTPIPLFGNSTTTNRRLDELMARASKPPRKQKDRLLQEAAGSTCICDSTSITQRDAPSRAAIRAGLEALIPDQLPWAQNPSICGLPVDVEIPCPAIPAGPSTTITMRFYARRSDGGCLKAADLQVMATQFTNTFNSNMQLGHFACEPQYLQVSNVIIDPSTLGGCRRELLRGSKPNGGETQSENTSRELLQDYDGVLASMTVTGNIYAINVDAILASESSGLRTAAASITETSGGLYDIETGSATKTPSAMPSAFPSGFPSAFPSEFPSDKPSAFPSESPSDKPSKSPSAEPTSKPSRRPSANPSNTPTIFSSSGPTSVPSSQPSELCPTLSDSCTGPVSVVQKWCDSLAGADACCTAAGECVWAGEATIFKGSCRGQSACDFGTASLSISVGTNSCVGLEACFKMLFTKGGSISIGSDSCTGPNTCWKIGYSVGTSVVIAKNSCIGGTIGVACQQIGGLKAVSVTIGANSCTKTFSCSTVGDQAPAVTIGGGSCTENSACQAVGEQQKTNPVIITDSSCTSSCSGSCGYLISVSQCNVCTCT